MEDRTRTKHLQNATPYFWLDHWKWDKKTKAFGLKNKTPFITGMMMQNKDVKYSKLKVLLVKNYNFYFESS